MTNQVKFSLTFLFSLTLFFANCGVNDQEFQDPAIAELDVQFFDSEAEEPLADTEVLVSAVYQNEVEPIVQGTLVTDEAGSFDGTISHPNERVITRLIFELEVDGEQHVIEEDVNLELRFEEPYDSVELMFEV